MRKLLFIMVLCSIAITLSAQNLQSNTHSACENNPKWHEVNGQSTQHVTVYANSLPVEFNEGVELMAMVWRLFGDRPYSYNTVPAYCESADEYFAAYKNHSVVAKAQEYDKTGIGYDAVASYGLHLLISPEGNIAFNQQLTKGGDMSFDRWTEKQKKEFLPLLEDFYKQSNFHKWYVSTAPLREEAKQAFSIVAQQIDMQWFDEFFGKKSDNTQFEIVLSILAGVNNYGCSAKMENGGERLSPVISCCKVDDEGQLHYDPDVVLPIVIHEFCHSYCNPLNTKNWKSMKKGADKVFYLERDKLTMQAYPTSKIMLDETFVRASVIRYLLAHTTESKEADLIDKETRNGFLFTADYVEALNRYEQQRNRYASMKSFMPEIVKIVNAFDIEAYRSEQEESARHNATYTCNIADGATDIPSGEFNLTITFSKPIEPTIALGYGRGNGQFLPLARGKESINWDESHTTLTIELRLETNTQYSFSILGDHYKTVDGYTAGETMNIDFKTK